MGIWGDVGRVFGGAARGVGEAARDAADGFEQAARTAWHAAGDVARTAQDADARARSSVTQGITRGAVDLAQGIQRGDVLGGLKDAVPDVAAGVGRGLSDTWNGTTDAVGQAYRGLIEAGDTVGATASRAYDRGVDGLARGVSEVAGERAGDAVRTAGQAVGDGVRQAVQFQYGVQQGVLEGAGALVDGVGDLVVGGVRLGTDAEYRDRLVAQAEQLAGRAGQAIVDAAHDPAGAARAAGRAVEGAVDGVIQDGKQAAREGRLSEYIGRGVGRVGFEVAATVVAPEAKVAEVASGAGRVAEAVSTTGRAVEGATDAARAAEIAAEGAEGAAVTADVTAAGGARTGGTVTEATADRVGDAVGAGGDTTTVYRVEGEGNRRVNIGEGGGVDIPGVRTNQGRGPERNLYLNFGDEARAQEFLQQRLEGGFPDNVIKSFDVPSSFVDELRANAVPEAERSLHPTSPVIADPTKAADQFGLPGEWIQRLRDAAIQGSGQVHP